MASGLFASVQQAISAKVKDQATSARERFQAVSEKVLQEVVESEIFKKHVAFNADSFLTEETATIEREEAEPREPVGSAPKRSAAPVGFVTVSVSKLAGLRANAAQPYCEILVEGDTKRTPIGHNVASFDWDRTLFEWDDSEGTLSFAVSNLKSTIAIRVLLENVVSHDEYVGQVIIPIERLLPPPLEEFAQARLPEDERRTKHTEGPFVYELYPLPKERYRFQPAVRSVAKTGMDKPSNPLGYLRIKTDLVLLDASSPFKIMRLYTSVPETIKRRSKRTPFDNVTLDVARVQRHVQRQLKRLELIAERIIVGQFPPTLALGYARSWQSPIFSAVFISCTSIAILHLPSFLAPMYSFVALCIGSFLSRSQGEDPPIIWNEEIRDPDDVLNPMQRLSKLLWVLETMSVALVDYTDFFERIIHAYGFRDERASLLLLIETFGLCVMASLVIYFVSFRTLVFLLYNIWNFAPVDFEKLYKRSSALLRAGKSPIDPNAVYGVMTPFSRVPTSEYIGHLNICKSQIVQNKAIIDSVERTRFEELQQQDSSN